MKYTRKSTEIGYCSIRDQGNPVICGTERQQLAEFVVNKPYYNKTDSIHTTRHELLDLVSDDKMEAKINSLKKRMKDVKVLEGDEDFFLKEETLARFLKSRDWDLDEAEKMLKLTVEYRRQTNPLKLDCHWCHDRPGYHSMRQVGFDESGRPVIYSSFSQTATHKNCVEDSVTHCTYLIENAKLTMRPGVTTWVFIIDCSGMTLTACNPKLGYGVTQVMSNHYPERLGLVICLNHNPVFQGVWKAIKVFLHPNTVAKMKLVRSQSKVLKVFQKYFSDELTKWLLREIELNKMKPIPKSQTEFWASTDEGMDHDPRGCPSYVKSFIEPYPYQSTNDSRVHRPHPNIVDSLKGNVLRKEISIEEKLERETLSAEDEITKHFSSDEDSDESFTEIEVGDELKVSSVAK